MTRTYQCINRISLTPENEHKIRTMSKSKTKKEVAAAIGCSIWTVDVWAKKLGVSFRKEGQNNHSAKLSFEDVEMIRDLREHYNLKQKEIAEKFEVSRSVVSRICNYKDRLTC